MPFTERLEFRRSFRVEPFKTLRGKRVKREVVIPEGSGEDEVDHLTIVLNRNASVDLLRDRITGVESLIYKTRTGIGKSFREFTGATKEKINKKGAPWIPRITWKPDEGTNLQNNQP